jgi:bifunctional isochorismate lyase/aryl carrier protein
MALPMIEPYKMPTESELTPDQVGWRPEASRAALLIHDMQQYFVDAFPASHAPITDLVENIALLRETARSLGMPVIYTAQPGGMTPTQRGLLHDFWGPGMGVDADRQIIASLTPGPQDVVLTKWRYSAFHGTTLANLLHRYRCDQLVICGIYAHIGCLMTACDAFTRDIEAFLVADAVADFSLAHHMMGLDYAAQRCAVTVRTRVVVDSVIRSRESVDHSAQLARVRPRPGDIAERVLTMTHDMNHATQAAAR